MRAYLPAYELAAPRTLGEALTLLASDPGRWRPFAGGTDLMVLFEAGKLTHQHFVSLWELRELRGITVDPDAVTIGALTTYSEIQRHPVLAAEFGLLCQAGRETGAIAIQNRGTLGGNIANASPAADSPPALLVYQAELELASAKATRWVAYEQFHTGYKTTLLRSDELITRVRLKRATQKFLQHYRKVGTRKAQAISKVCLAALAHLSEGKVQEVRLALGSVAPTAVRLRATENALTGKRLEAATISAAKLVLVGEIAPIDDIRSTAQYRAQVAANLVEEFLERCGTGSVS